MSLQVAPQLKDRQSAGVKRSHAEASASRLNRRRWDAAEYAAYCHKYLWRAIVILHKCLSKS